ncbi:hypothetical protein [Microbacterium sp. NPDC077184]|uniref:hypothetical protein n=1 Tax=Microbacterium sp. NPDC077184 TaxID=3154764 RepID=UPI003445A173
MTLITPEPDGGLVSRVRAVDGVVDVYGSPLQQLSGILAAATGRSGERQADVAVSMRDGIPRVAARIATDPEYDTPETARRVADVLAENSPEDATITVQIARIH